MAYFGPGLYEFYGSTELGVNTILRPEDMLRKPGSCGRAAPGIELAILDDDGRPRAGGRAGRAPRAALSRRVRRVLPESRGHRRDAAGRLALVGDVAYVDAEGFYYICDRKRDMIISAGVNIYPAEIEDVLHRHPEVADAAVFGVPDDEWGERVHAARPARAPARRSPRRRSRLLPGAHRRLQDAPRGLLPRRFPARRPRASSSSAVSASPTGSGRAARV